MYNEIPIYFMKTLQVKINLNFFFLFFEQVQFYKVASLFDLNQNLIQSVSDFLVGEKKQHDITLLAIERK